MTQSQIESLDLATSTLTLSLDTDLYPRDVLYSAAYVFLDRAYILLDREDARYLIRLRGKAELDEATLRAMAGEFENELLAQALRDRVGKANQNIIESITALAVGGATAATLTGGSDGEDTLVEVRDPGLDGFVDDPDGLGTPWESKKGSFDE